MTTTELDKLLNLRRLKKWVLAAFALPAIVFAAEPQWETLTPPPGAENECVRLFEDTGDNSFTKGWAESEVYLQKDRHYQGSGNRRTRLRTPRPFVKVLFPSMTMPYSVIGSIKNIEAYELRGFCPEVMKAAKDPSAHLVIVTSVLLEEATVQNCIRLAMMAKVPPESLDRHVADILNHRIHFMTADNPSPLPLSQKFLQNSEKMQELKSLIDGIKAKNKIPDEGAYMQTFVTTPQEGWVADQLGISVWGNPLLNAGIEKKSTYHNVAQRAGVKKADAEIGIFSEAELVDGIYNIMERNLKRVFRLHSGEGFKFSLPRVQKIYEGLSDLEKIEMVKRLMQKWDQGTSGQGNSPKMISDEAISAYFSGSREFTLSVIRGNLTKNMETANSKTITPKMFIETLTREGGVVEQYVPYVQTFLNSDGKSLPVSPSGQGDIRNSGISIMGCHEQKFIPGVPGGVFEGAIYGWSRLGEDICQQVYEKTLALGRVLKELGYLGRYSVDYVVAKNPATQELEVIIIEINARSGGTHTVDAMLAVTSAYKYSEELVNESSEAYHWYAQVMDPDGAFRRVKLYNEGTDNFYHQGLKLFCSDQELLDFLYNREAQFWISGQNVPMANSVNKRGVLPHMIQGRKGSDGEPGKLGFVAIGHDSYEDAHQLFVSFSEALTEALDKFQELHAQRTCQ